MSTLNLKGNKGEWSELYCFFKLLGTGKLAAANSNLEEKKDIIYPVSSVIQNTTSGFTYKIDSDITLLDKNNNILTTKSKFEILSAAQTILQAIQINKKGTFEIPEIDSILKDLQLNTIKAKNSDKRDITVNIFDPHLNDYISLGFSIKSQLGQPATLLNASKSTNVIYKLNSSLSTLQVNTVQKLPSIKSILEYLEDEKICISYDSMENEKFNRNLQMLDFGLPKIYAELLFIYFSKKNILGENINNTLSDISNSISINNPLKISSENFPLGEFYNYKLKEFLTSIALGFVPSTLWSGQYDASGGYIIVKENGDLVCYNVYNRNDFRDYLFKNTKLDTPSQTRHQFGQIYSKDTNFYIKLNAQIRFIK